MRKQALLILMLTTVACGGGSGSGGGVTQPPSTGTRVVRQAKWALSWGDEFDGATVDPTNWIVQNGAANVNNELEYYSPSEVYIENGSLVLKSEIATNGARRYASGEVRTGNLRTVRQGNAVEWRTQAPAGKGIWPANWLVNTQCDGLNGCGINWPPEIDVLELQGSAPTINLMTHWWSTWPNEQHETTSFVSTTSFADDYHTFRLEWFPDSVVWYIDGVQRAKHVSNVTSGLMQIVMNTAIGGLFDGNPDQTTVFPQYHRIDYVRVYRDTANVY
ncbi:MAG TPA: glycoside hydrolase family 16 protein [Gemmatimonadaceae bacterium]|nr:glycoside hydrolase family 16 protein [Gemmatimonadaceae bacterium]